MLHCFGIFLFSNPFIPDLYLKSCDAMGKGGQGLKANHKQPKGVFSVFEAFSFLLNNGNWLRG